jgi:AcrR family transcriptional regulator
VTPSEAISAERSQDSRPRKKVTTRTELLKAAEEIFAATGTIDVTVEQICRHAGYTRGAFYSSFTTVDELFFALWEKMTDRFEEMRDDADPLSFLTNPSDDPTEFIRNLQKHYSRPQWFSLRSVLVARARRDPELASRLRNRMVDATARLQSQLVAWSEQSGRRMLVDPGVFTRAAMAAYDGALGNDLFSDDGDEVGVAAVAGVMLGLTESRSA